MCKLQIQSEWQAVFREKSLDSIGAVLALETKKPDLPCQPCGELETLPLTATMTLCLKRDKKVGFARIFRELLSGRLPKTRTARDRQAIALLGHAGFKVPRIVAWGEKRCCGLPECGVLFLQPPAGRTLPDFLGGELDGRVRREAIEKAEKTLAALHSGGYSWPDCRPANFILQDDGDIALINLENLTRRKALSPELCQQQFEVFYAGLFE